MKKIITIAAAIAMLNSCKKDESTCNCGKIIDDNAFTYSVTIRNSCTGNNKEFFLTRGDWMTAYVGSDYCITNSGKW